MLIIGLVIVDVVGLWRSVFFVSVLLVGIYVLSVAQMVTGLFWGISG